MLMAILQNFIYKFTKIHLYISSEYSLLLHILQTVLFQLDESTCFTIYKYSIYYN